MALPGKDSGIKTRMVSPPFFETLLFCRLTQVKRQSPSMRFRAKSRAPRSVMWLFLRCNSSTWDNPGAPMAASVISLPFAESAVRLLCGRVDASSTMPSSPIALSSRFNRRSVVFCFSPRASLNAPLGVMEQLRNDRTSRAFERDSASAIDSTQSSMAQFFRYNRITLEGEDIAVSKSGSRLRDVNNGPASQSDRIVGGLACIVGCFRALFKSNTSSFPIFRFVQLMLWILPPINSWRNLPNQCSRFRLTCAARDRDSKPSSEMDGLFPQFMV
mmetsp:Transcript_849/g.1729  ORF Transcript_849/g.1729 Transcript_849/m.1729 type:complete len:273 (-) Transcript_849:455-1273(-)